MARRVNARGQNLWSYPVGERGIPEVLEYLITKLQKVVEVPGIFRKSPELEKFEGFYRMLEQGRFWSEEELAQEPHFVSKGILTFLSNLKQRLLSEQTLEDPRLLYRESVEFRVLERVIKAMQDVAKSSERNNMTS